MIRPSGAIALWALLISAFSGGISILVTLLVLIRLPSDAFAKELPGWPKSWSDRLLRLGANAIGWLLIGVGLVLAVPGVPGQGLLTIAMGLLLVDFPGRARLLRGILSRPRVRRSVDRLRLRFGRPPFTW